MRRNFSFLVLVLALLTSACSNTTVIEPKPDFLQSQVRYTTVKGDFEEIKSFLELAITDRGIKINNVSHIAEMLQRTAADVGASATIFTHGQAIEFCSATISRNMMQSNSHYIALCPYIIYIYELPQQPGTIHISYRNLLLVDKSDPSLGAVDKLLQDIIKDLEL